MSKNNNNPWPCLVLAGSRGPTDPVAAYTGASCKALAPLLGRPMILYPLDALTASPLVGDITLSLETSAPAMPEGPWKRLDALGTPATSVLDGFNRLGFPLFVTTGDHALLTPEMIAQFLERAETSGADVCAAVAPREVVEQAGSGAKRTYLKFTDGWYSGCNMFLLRTERAGLLVDYWKKLESLRKQPAKMAGEIGWTVLLRYLTRTLSSKALTSALHKKTGVRAALIKMDIPTAAHDVDKASDIEFAEKTLKERGFGS